MMKRAYTLLSLLIATQALAAVELDLDSNGAIDIARGGTNGATIEAATANFGLGTAAFEASTAFATAAQGALADTAIQAETDGVWAAWLAATPPAYPGTTIGKALLLTDDGLGNPVLTIDSINLDMGSKYLVNNVPLDISNLTDTNNLLDFTSLATNDLSDWPITVSPTEVGYLSNVSSDIQQQFTDVQSQISSLTTPITLSAGTPADITSGMAWVDTTDNSFNVASSTGIYTYTGTYAAFDQTPILTGSFSSVTDATISTLYTTTDHVAISDINAPTAISVSGTGCEYQINSGSFTSSPGTVISGNTFDLRQTSSSSNSTETVCTGTVGGVSKTFSVTTIAASGNETFNATGYDLSSDWTETDTGSVVDPDSTGQVISGQSLFVNENLTATENFTCYDFGSGSNTRDITFNIYIDSLTLPAVNDVFSIAYVGSVNTGQTLSNGVLINVTNNAGVNKIYGRSTTSGTQYSVTMDSWFTVQIQYTRNGTSTVTFSGSQSGTMTTADVDARYFCIGGVGAFDSDESFVGYFENVSGL